MSKKRLDQWVRWALEHLEHHRIDPFLQGWRCCFAMLMAHGDIPQEVRKKMARASIYAEDRLFRKTRRKRR